MKQIYICTQQAEENRVIIVHNGKVVGYEQERLGEENRKGNIYKGVVSLVEAGLDAAFVDIGEHKNGLLPLREIPPDVFGRPVKEGDQILVQIKKGPYRRQGRRTDRLYLACRPFLGFAAETQECLDDFQTWKS